MGCGRGSVGVEEVAAPPAVGRGRCGPSSLAWEASEVGPFVAGAVFTLCVLMAGCKIM